MTYTHGVCMYVALLGGVAWWLVMTTTSLPEAELCAVEWVSTHILVKQLHLEVLQQSCMTSAEGYSVEHSDMQMLEAQQCSSPESAMYPVKCVFSKMPGP